MYQPPSWNLIHAARDGSIIAATNEDPAFPRQNLADDRVQSLYKTNSPAVQQIDIDRGMSPTPINRVYIPAPFVLSAGWRLLGSADAAFTAPTTLIASGPSPATGSIDTVLDGGASSADRYLRLETGVSEDIELPQLYITFRLTPGHGPEPDWSGPVPQENAFHERKSSGARAHLELGPDQEIWRFAYRRVGAQATSFIDLLYLDLLIDHGTTKVFLFDPPDDSAYLPIFVTLTFRDRRNDHPNPAAFPERRMRYEWEVTEHTG